MLPKNVSKIHMVFAARMKDGHLGPRKFWRQCLPRLKYHNPTVSMTVERNTNQEGPAVMTVHFTEADAAKEAEKVVTIDMKYKHESEILAQVMELTKAEPVSATQEEIDMLQKLEEAQKKSDEDRARNEAYKEAKARSDAILAQARSGSV